jgi:OmpA-OmpF porin, OOP family
MRKKLLYALPVTLAVGAFAVAGHAATLFPLFPNVEKVRTTQPAGDGFEQRLAREYRDLAIFEADEMGDWPDAEIFAGKSLRAGGGEVPMPAEAGEWDIGNAATRSELDAARSDLVSVLQDGRGRAPVEAAVAQARYDCWVEQEEEGHQYDHIAACRSSYMTAMEALRGAMQPTRTTFETVQEEIARETVYFDWDSATIRPDQQAELDQFLNEMRKIEPVVLYIEGHTDTSGPVDYNEELSRRRAEAVRAELVRQGMTVGEIKDLQLAAKGQTEPAVPTGDGVREERNRRVVMIATGQTTRTGQTTSTVQGATPLRQ